MSNLESLKNLAVKVTGKKAEEIAGDTNAELIQFISDNYSGVSSGGGSSAGMTKEVIELGTNETLTIYGGSLCVLELHDVSSDNFVKPNIKYVPDHIVHGMVYTLADSSFFVGDAMMSKSEHGDVNFQINKTSDGNSIVEWINICGTVIWTI